ncbi:MAG: hypothetical protein K0R31_2266 [Clostridiales bacterium]|nr:hypothetical protein [Clostridiales bacterium]MDF2986766.1 hypothetical protein [Eubacterium sp.]
MSTVFNNKEISEANLRKFIQFLEQAYVEREEEKLTELFHPDRRKKSFLKHFEMQMLYQIYDIQSEILNFKLIDISEDKATLLYSRKHTYTCKNIEDEIDETPNNITSFYVEIISEDNSLYIFDYSSFSVLYLDKNGEVLPDERAVVPKRAQFFANMQRFINFFDLKEFTPATYKVYSDSEYIGYYPKEEIYEYNNSRSFTIDYFEEMNASSLEEHTNSYIDQELVLGKVIEQAEDYSIIETQFMRDSQLNHELVLSLLAFDGFFMMRYQKSTNAAIDNETREAWIQQMKKATSVINNV